MNSTEKKITATLQQKTAFAVITVHLISIAVIFLALGAFSRREGARDIRATVEKLEKSVSTEKSIVDAVARLSDLARESGYELAVDDIIKDHRAAMTAVKGNLAVLKDLEREKTGGNVLIYAVIVVAVQGVLLLLFLLKLNRSASFTLRLIARQIDNALAGEKIDRNGEDSVIELRGLYDSFGELLNRIEEQSTKKTKSSINIKKPT